MFRTKYDINEKYLICFCLDDNFKINFLNEYESDDRRKFQEQTFFIARNLDFATIF